jgi:RNA-splicing ligase RtcB
MVKVTSAAALYRGRYRLPRSAANPGHHAPTAYKRIEQVIADLVDHGLATSVASTVPLVTYKTPDLGRTPQRERRDHRRKRGRP